MGPDGRKPRKRSHHLRKVSKYEEPNRLEGAQGGGGFGRSGHSADHHHNEKPTGVGAWVLKRLQRKPNP